jgi:hypothetical protein
MIKTTKGRNVPVKRETWCSDAYHDLWTLNKDQLLLAAANSNVACDPDASLETLRGALHELHYVTVLRNENTGEFRLMKS